MHIYKGESRVCTRRGDESAQELATSNVSMSEEQVAMVPDVCQMCVRCVSDACLTTTHQDVFRCGVVDLVAQKRVQQFRRLLKRVEQLRSRVRG